MIDKSCKNILLVFVGVLLAITFFFYLLTNCVKVDEAQVCVPDTIVANHIKIHNDTVTIKKSELDTLLKKYNESVREIQRKNSLRVEQKLESVNNNISIWLAIIAAICTLLPMASTFYQTSLLDKKSIEMDDKVKGYEKDINEIRLKQKEIKDDIQGSYQQYITRTKHEEFISSLGILESTIMILCEYQDLQNRNRLALADKSYIESLRMTIQNLSNLCTKYSRDHSQALEADQVLLVKSSILMAYNSFSHLLVVLETIAPGECIINVLSKKDELRSNIRKFLSSSTAGSKGQNQDIDSQIHYLGSFADQMMELLRECLESEKK